MTSKKKTVETLEFLFLVYCRLLLQIFFSLCISNSFAMESIVVQKKYISRNSPAHIFPLVKCTAYQKGKNKRIIKPPGDSTAHCCTTFCISSFHAKICFFFFLFTSEIEVLHLTPRDHFFKNNIFPSRTVSFYKRKRSLSFRPGPNSRCRVHKKMEQNRHRKSN